MEDYNISKAKTLHNLLRLNSWKINDQKNLKSIFNRDTNMLDVF